MGDGVAACITGRIRAVERNLRLRVGVVTTGFPFWAWAVRAAPEMNLTWIWGARGAGCVPTWNSCSGWKVVDGNAETLLATLEQDPVDILLFDDVRVRSTAAVWKNPVLKLIAWNVGCRQAPASWSSRVYDLVHADMGGVTTDRSIVVVSVPDGSNLPRRPHPQHLPSSVQRILKHRAPNWRSICAPDLDKDGNVLGDDAIAPGGLLRWKHRERPIRVRSVLCESGWCRRKLTLDELATAMDVPDDVWLEVDEPLQRALVEAVGIPYKSRLALLEACIDVLWQPAASRSRSTPYPPQRYTVAGSTMKPVPAPTPNANHRTPPPPVLSQTREERALKATKADDAVVPEYLWKERILSGVSVRTQNADLNAALQCLQRAALKYWRRCVVRSFWEWWNTVGSKLPRQNERAASLAKGKDAIARAYLANWWNWDGGSAPFFWRWPAEFVEEIRDGVPPLLDSVPPRIRDSLRWNPNPVVRQQEKKKIDKLRDKAYVLQITPISALMNCFSVPKGDDDIRMVFDATKSGLNDSLFAPWFTLPMVDTMLRTVEAGTWCADNDFGEMFYNFWLHEDFQCYCGLDVSELYPTEGKRVWVRWTRPAMGLKPAPYIAVQGALRAKEFMRGDPSDSSNVFRWDWVDINLPGQSTYCPAKPWIAKRRRSDGKIAAAIHQYVDDNRETAPTQEEAWQASSVVAKACTWLGLQDAARKRREPSQCPGAWAGSVVWTEGEAVYKLVAPDRWEKTRKEVAWLADRVLHNPLRSSEGEILLPWKRLASVRGFLTYVSRTYRAMVPYLKGVHLTLDSWRPGRDDEGWKLIGSGSKFETSEATWDGPPNDVVGVKRLPSDVRALLSLTESRSAPRILARPTDLAAASFGFADASGAGFGVSIWSQDTPDDVDYEFGVWDGGTGHKSSNFRELSNVVHAIESAVRSRDLHSGAELFLFTDNVVTERAFYRGTSSSKTLFQLVLRLRKLEMTGSLFVHVVWVAGRRMIAQGTDGLSRGNLSVGVLAGRKMLTFVPLHENALQRCPDLRGWIRSWVPEECVELSVELWFTTAHSSGSFLWTPAPAIADVALEELCEARHKRPWCWHVFVCPSLMTSRWRKQLHKAADLQLTIRPGFEFWPDTMFESLTIAIVCPLLRRHPWQARRHSRVAEFGSTLYQMREAGAATLRDHLRKFWNTTDELARL